MTKDNKMDFIICYNSVLYKDECVAYIEALRVPEDMEIGILTVDQARSLTAGYNEAMQASDAKYKVYLHQDVFILYENFISDVVDTFLAHPQCGMLGVVGSDRKVENGCYWNQWNCGRTRVSTPLYDSDKEFGPSDQYMPVEVIDGMLMITQVDLSWREDVFDGFHFYDASQCEEMKRAGYEVGMVPQERSWCLHDCGCNSMSNYDEYREKFCACYAKEGYRYEELPKQKWFREMGAVAAKFREAMILYFNEENWDQVANLLQQYESLLSHNTDLQYLIAIYGILVRQSHGGGKQIYREGKTFEEYKEEYMRNLFAERRKLK